MIGCLELFSLWIDNYSRFSFNERRWLNFILGFCFAGMMWSVPFGIIPLYLYIAIDLFWYRNKAFERKYAKFWSTKTIIYYFVLVTPFALVGTIEYEAIMIIAILTISFYLLPSVKNEYFWYGVFTGVLILGLTIIGDLLITNSRPDGVFKNAVMAAEIMGLILLFKQNKWMFVVFGAATLSRTFLAMVASYILFDRKYWKLLVLACVVFAVVSFGVGSDRTQVITNTAEHIETYSYEFKLFGWGYNQYARETGLQHPHNFFINGLLQFGIIAIPWFVVIGLLAWKVNWKYWIPILITMFADGDLLFTAQGTAAVATYYTLAYKLGGKIGYGGVGKDDELLESINYPVSSNVEHMEKDKIHI